MADIDRTKFAYAVAGSLHKLGIPGPREAQRKFPDVKLATWTRVSQANHSFNDATFGAICKVLDLDIRDYVILKKRNPQDMHALKLTPKKPERNQTVSRKVSRETVITDGWPVSEVRLAR